MKSRFLAVNTSLQFIEAFDNAEALIARCPGLEIAEGDWLFFAPDGSRLEAEFSVDPEVERDGHWVFTDGVYSLRKAEGLTFQEWMSEQCQQNGDLLYGTRAYFYD
jgi:hypothetical protein